MPLTRLSAAEQASYLKLVLDSTMEGFYSVDTEGHTTLCNSAFLRMLGYASAEEVIGRKLHSEMHHSHADGSPYDLKDCPIYQAARGAPGQFVPQEIFFRKDGTSFPVEYRVEPILQDGVPQGAVCTFLDITEKLKQQRAIDDLHAVASEAAERIGLALDSGTILGTWVWDIKEDRMTGDARFAHTFNLDKNRLQKGMKLAEATLSIHPHDVDDVNQTILDTLRSGGSYRKQYRVRQPEGTWLWVEANGRVEFDSAGKASRLLGALIDIDERKRVEIAFEKTQARYYDLFNSIDQGFCLIEVLFDAGGEAHDYRFIEVNSAFAAQTGLEDMVGKTMRSVAPNHEQHWFEIYGQVALTGKPARFINFAESLNRWFDVYAFRAGETADNTVAVLFKDVTEEKTAQENLLMARNAAEAANIAKTEFLANMSHEIRTPMNAIVGLSNILVMSQPLTEQQRQFVKTLQLSADSLLSLINDLLDISKIETNTVELEQIPFNITRLINDVISMMAVRVKEKGLTFTSNGESVRSRSYIGDPHRLRQIVLNLCSNAIKFTETGTIHVELTHSPTPHAGVEDICIAVRDTGIGIAADKLETIFEKFIQADSSINRKYGGTGLGLAITKTIAEIMGGTVRVESEVGKGSTFTVCVPLRRATDEEVRQSNDSLKEIGTRTITHRIKPRVLLVEDYQPNVLVATTVLGGFGYHVEVAGNGIEAIEMVKNNQYIAVLMDVQMHGMNGLDATQAIRAHETQRQLPHIHIIGMTAHALAGDRERCLAAGMDDYLSKPFDPDTLKEKLLLAVEAEA